MVTDALGGLLQLLTAASFVAAFVVLLINTGKTPGTELGTHGLLPREPFRAFLWVAAAAVGSRLLLVALAWAALNLAHAIGSEEVRAQLAGYGFSKPFPPLESLFSRWDAPHYLDIAKMGYTAERLDPPWHDQWLFIVFYPLYPALAALLKPVFGSVFNAATAVSWACLAGACWFVSRLTAADGERSDGARAVKYLLVFPAAVFLGAPYTESLFLLLSALCLWALRNEKWWLAGLAGFLAALTRNLGVLLAVPFAVELLDRTGALSEPRRLFSRGFWPGFLKSGAWVLLIPLGAGVYLLINQLVYGDPFMFLKIQENHWGQRMQAPWKTVLTTWRELAGPNPFDRKFWLWGPQLIGMVSMLAALPFLMRRLRPAWACYLLVYTIVALTPSWLLSFNRYMMGAVPLFLGLAVFGRRKWADALLTAIFTAAMLVLAAGYLMWKHVV